MIETDGKSFKQERIGKVFIPLSQVITTILKAFNGDGGVIIQSVTESTQNEDMLLFNGRTADMFWLDSKNSCIHVGKSTIYIAKQQNMLKFVCNETN